MSDYSCIFLSNTSQWLLLLTENKLVFDVTYRDWEIGGVGGEPIDVGGWEMGESGGGSGVKRGEKLGGHHVNPFSLNILQTASKNCGGKPCKKRKSFKNMP